MNTTPNSSGNPLDSIKDKAASATSSMKSGASSAGSKAEKHAHKASQNPIFVNLARAGFVVSGILHFLIGWISVRLAMGNGGGEASNSGAMSEIAKNPGGQVLLWFMVVGLAALALWRFMQIFVSSEAKDKAKGGVLGVVFASLAFTTATFASGGQSSDNESATDAIGMVLGFPGGRIAVIIAGLVVIGVGVHGIYKGATKKFKEDLEAGASGGKIGKGIEVAGVAGHIARGAAFVVLGGLIIWAAWSYDPEKAGGMDAALETIGSQPFGDVLLVITGVGIALYGIYSIARAKYTNEI